MKHFVILFSFLAFAFQGCISDDIIEDFVEPTLRFVAVPETIAEGSSFQFEVMYFNNVGSQETITPEYESSDSGIVSIDESGLAIANMDGDATITASYTNNDDVTVSQAITVSVEEETVLIDDNRGGTIATTSSYKLEGDFTIEEDGDDLVINIAENYSASSALPGLYIYLTNNTNSTNNALEIAAVTVFDGAHSYTVDNVGINEYSHILYFCKPFNVKVGDGEIQ